MLHEAQETYPEHPVGRCRPWWLPARLGGSAPDARTRHWHSTVTNGGAGWLLPRRRADGHVDKSLTDRHGR